MLMHVHMLMSMCVDGYGDHHLFFETEPLIDLDFAKQSRLAGQWAPWILFSISTFPTMKFQEHAACHHALLFFTWILRTELGSSWLTHVSLYILHVKTTPHSRSRLIKKGLRIHWPFQPGSPKSPVPITVTLPRLTERSHVGQST